MNNNKHLLNCDKIRIETYQGHWFGVFRIVAATDVIHGTQLALANGRNIAGQRLPTLLNVTLCVRLYTPLQVVSCCWELLRKV